MSFLLTGPNAISSLLFFGLSIPTLPIATEYKAKQSISDVTLIIGSSLKIDARHSIGANQSPPKYYYWRFSAVPIGSQAGRVGFESLELDDSVVSITPDITGFYRVELVVGDDNYNSNPTYADVYVKVLDVPYGQGLTPDADFIWDYLGNFWDLFSDKKTFSTMWSSYVQILTNRLLSLYQIDFNKSITTIQDLFQRKWLDYNPELQVTVDDTYYILGEDYCGISAFSNNLQLTNTGIKENQISILESEGNLVVTPYGKKINKRIMRYWDSSHNLFRSDVVTYGGPPTKYSLMFTSSDEIITSNDTHPWRLCYTLGSYTTDFEKLGVKVGDRLKVSVQVLFNGQSSGRTSFLYLPVIAVREGKLGFSFSDLLVDGQKDTGLSDEIVRKLVEDLQLDGLFVDLLGNITYVPNTVVSFIKEQLLSVAFKRKYYEEQLTTKNFELGYFQSSKVSISVVPVSIYRSSAISIATDILSVPTLQEYIEQPGYSEANNKKYIIKDTAEKEATEVYRTPLFLFENLDFITSKEELEVECTFVANNKVVTSIFGDFVDRSIEQGDILQVTGLNGGTSNFKEYVILAARPTEIDIYPLPAFSVVTKCKIVRRIPGNFIRFVKDAFSATGPIEKIQPPKLWSEVTFFDNGKTIEDNFGSLVTITREELKKQKVTSSYKSAVAGLLYGLAKGPSLKDLKIGAQILLGLPFTYYQGKIIEIKPNYELGPNFEPKTGRISIEETDKHGKTTGLITNYFYPQGAQLNVAGKWVPADPSFSGIAINPNTNVEYKVGDIVSQFAPLSKGVEVVDYISDPAYVDKVASSFIGQLQKYHTIYLRANTDLFNGPDFSFVSKYINLVKPAFLFLKSVLEKSNFDELYIEDELKITAGVGLFDVEGLSLPLANKFDYYADSSELFTMDGRMFTRLIKGKDLNTNGTSVSSPSGGFITARANEFHDTPFITVGDRLVIYTGPNNGYYDILSVVDDQTVTVASNLDVVQGQTFAIYHEIKNPIFTGSTLVSVGSTAVTLPSGNFTAGLAVGDSIFFYTTNRSRIYRIEQINGAVVTINEPFTLPTATYSFVAFREKLLTKYLLSDASTYPFTVSFTTGNPWAVVTGNIQLLIAKKQDVLIPGFYPTFEILDFDETLNAIYLSPTPGFTDSDLCQINRPFYSTTFPIDADAISTSDEVEAEIVPVMSTAVCTSGSATVTFSGGTNLATWNILPGDFFKLYTGVDSTIDIGYGNGVFVIAECTASQIILTRPLIATQNTATYTFKRTTVY